MELSLQGTFTFNDNERVRALIEEASESSCSSCKLDLKALDSIDSAGLGMFLLINDAVVGDGKTLELHNATGQVHKMLEISKFSEIITIRP